MFPHFKDIKLCGKDEGLLNLYNITKNIYIYFYTTSFERGKLTCVLFVIICMYKTVIINEEK
jgi:hypothetical protein